MYTRLTRRFCFIFRLALASSSLAFLPSPAGPIKSVRATLLWQLHAFQTPFAGVSN
jgi:hypothetical protein